MNKVYEQNKRTVRALFRAIDEKDKDRFMAAEHPDFSLQFPGLAEPLRREGHWQMALQHGQAYSNMQHIPEFQIVEANYVVTKGIITGTNDGSYHGRPATYRKIRVPFICICTMKDGKIIAIESLFDTLAEYNQLYAESTEEADHD